MIKYLVIMFLLLSSPCLAATQQVFVWGIASDLDASITEYSSFPADGSSANWSSTEVNEQTLIPANGIIDDLRILLENDPDNASSGESYTITIRLDGADTSLGCTISEGSTTCQDSDGFSVTAGQLIGIESVPANSPTVGKAYVSATWNPTVSDESILVGGTASSTFAGGTQYIAITGVGSVQPNEEEMTFIAPTDGVFKNLYIEMVSAPGGSVTRTFTFRDSASSESIDCSLSGATKTCNSTLETETATASAGEKFVLVATASGGTPVTSGVRVGIVFDPTTEGEWIIARSGTDDDTHATATEYSGISVGDISWSATEAGVMDQGIQTGSFASDMIIKNIYVENFTDPGTSADTYKYTLRANAANATPELSCTVNGTSPFTCNASATVTITDDDRMATQIVPTDTPAIGKVAISYTGFIDPSAVYTHLMVVD